MATLSALLLLTTAGCKSTKKLQRDKTAVTEQPSQVRDNERLKPRLDTIQNVYFTHYSSNFSCRVNDIGITGQIRILYDSIIWISVNKIIEVGRVMLTPHRVQGYVKIMDKYIDADYATLSKRWGIDIDFATIQALLLGNGIPGCKNDQEPTLSDGVVTMQCSQKSGATGQQRKVIMLKSQSTRRLTQSDIATTAPQQRLTLKYIDQVTVEGQLVPAVIDAIIKCRQYNGSTRLKLDKMVMNKQQNYPFAIPSRYNKL